MLGLETETGVCQACWRVVNIGTVYTTGALLEGLVGDCGKDFVLKLESGAEIRVDSVLYTNNPQMSVMENAEAVDMPIGTFYRFIKTMVFQRSLP